jgi:hypothetical protein
MLRKRDSSWLIYAVLTVVVVCMVAGFASAQEDFYYLTYYSDALAGIVGAPSGTVHIVNPGTALTKINANGKPLNGNLCADIYVLNNDQQVIECCGCLLTPDSERTIAINTGLLGNPDNPGLVTNDGVIKTISATPNPFCDPTGDTHAVLPTPELRLWATHIQTRAPSGFAETEEEFETAPLSSNELLNLENQCSAIFTSGSGPGVCSCGFGD